MRIMFDSNIFNHLEEIRKYIVPVADKYDFYVSSVQIEELCAAKDKETLIRLVLGLAEIRAKIVPTACAILGEMRLDYCRLGEAEVYKTILKKTKSNTKDAIIADTAVFEDCTLITEDEDLFRKMRKNGFAVMKLKEFIELSQRS